jgi:hypothetical protein
MRAMLFVIFVPFVVASSWKGPDFRDAGLSK